VAVCTALIVAEMQTASSELPRSKLRGISGKTKSLIRQASEHVSRLSQVRWRFRHIRQLNCQGMRSRANTNNAYNAFNINGIGIITTRANAA